MKILQIVYNINKIMPKVKIFLKFCQIWRVITSLNSIIYQNIKIELKNIFLFRRNSFSKLYRFLQIFIHFLHFVMTSWG